ncbi:hypothetical protein N7468_000296 [Penicillium chermesinum]|uniref:Uncharacterized protein n=1 Tax=Penicillium chermesinum TaxID=63820 RepID=A0A9W9PM06_9EURO|nr:uncharacterized protein N7468_000296 [Penicillium chermesinum]KAJ5248845.1 hypothetical protein N7468_000296 [Penicillium chermesinum]
MYNYLDVADETITKLHTSAQDQLPVVDRILEAQTISTHFLPFAFGKPLADGTWSEETRTDATLLAIDEIDILQANYPPGSIEPSILDRVSSRIGSVDDHERLCIIGKNIQSLKSRLWEGIIPISDQRWREKGLDRPENIALALEHLSAVLAVFAYLNDNIVRGYLRDTYNLIYDHWESLDAMLNEHRAKEGKLGPVSVANLWAVYMEFHFKMMTQRAHQWVIRHVEALRGPILEELRAHRGVTDAEGKPDETHWKLTNELQLLLETSVRADYTILMPMQGYKGVTPPKPGSGPPALYDADIEKRGPAFAERLKVLSYKIMFDKMLDAGLKTEEKSLGETYYESAMEQIEAHMQVRGELRGDSLDMIIPEPWIASIRLEKEENATIEHGLAIYRLTHGQTESEWAEFVRELESHISDWGEGQTGSEEIKQDLKLTWVDGNGFGFAEDDIAAAKTHFKQTFYSDDTGDNSNGLLDSLFLAIDSASFASYTTDTYRTNNSYILPGDLNGFVLAVDPEYDSLEGIERPDESPGYSGQMHVLGSLVWGDLFALMVSQSTGLEGLWPLAMEHPNQVYHGPTLPTNFDYTYWGIFRLVAFLVLVGIVCWYLFRYVVRVIRRLVVGILRRVW